MLIIVCGLSGTGKTTVARMVAEKFSAAHLRTDVIRKELSERPGYSEAEKEMVYQAMFGRAGELLKNGSVVLDATFLKKQHRETARELAVSARAHFYIVETTCPAEVVKKRLTERAGDASEARFGEYLNQQAAAEPISEEHFIVDTSKDIGEQIKKLPL